MAYASIEPFGALRDDLQAATIAAVVANTARDSDKKPDPFTPIDFIPDYWGERVEVDQHQTWQEQKAIIEALNAAMGGKDDRTV
jgi:hypothetical protein